jgi:hypothetical protein
MSDDIRRDLEDKDAELQRQRELADKGTEKLRGYDKTDADSFPASDPPSTMPGETGAPRSEGSGPR